MATTESKPASAYDGFISYSHAADDLLAQARARLTRGFTPGECATYQIDDCPTTLEEIRAAG